MMNIFGIETRNKRRRRFKSIINHANKIIEENYRKEHINGSKCKNHPIYNYIRLLGRSSQTNFMKSLLINGKELYEVEESTVFFDLRKTINVSGRNIRIGNLIEEINYVGELRLGRDVILPWTWNYDRYYSALCNFGSELHCEQWKEDKSNHDLELWLPVGIAFVRRGIIQ